MCCVKRWQLVKHLPYKPRLSGFIDKTVHQCRLSYFYGGINNAMLEVHIHGFLKHTSNITYTTLTLTHIPPERERGCKKISLLPFPFEVLTIKSPITLIQWGPCTTINSESKYLKANIDQPSIKPQHFLIATHQRFNLVSCEGNDLYMGEGDFFTPRYQHHVWISFL